MPKQQTPVARAIVLATLMAASALAGCAAPSTTRPALEPESAAAGFSESDITYAAARLQKAAFEYPDLACADGPHGARLAQAHAAFERANPGYRAALDGPAPSPAVDAATDALLIEFLQQSHHVGMLLRSMPPAELDAECARYADRRAATDFAAQRDYVRSKLAPP